MASAIPIMNKEQLDQQDIDRANALREEEQKLKSQDVISNLSAYLDTRFEAAKRAKLQHERQMLRNKRARQGVYETDKLAAIQMLHGKDYVPVYMMITSTKCRAAEAWIRDILLQSDDLPYDVEPTAVPELPLSIMKDIENRIGTIVIQQMMDQVMTGGMPISLELIQQKIEQVTPIIKERMSESVKRKAKETAKKMREKIKDQFQEGGWETALDEAIFDVVTYQAGLVKGPSLIKEQVRKGDLDPFTGKWKPKLTTEILPKYERRSPLNIYPSADAKGINDGYLFDLISLTRKDLSDMIGVPGFSETNIRAALFAYQNGYREWTAIGPERATLEGRDHSTIFESEKLDCLEYWGSAPGRLLKQWGLDSSIITDEEKEYNIAAWKIGPYVIKAMLNPDAKGKKPFYKASFEEDPDNFWGKGVPQLVWDSQQLGNAIGRAIVNNVGIASGPQVEINTNRKAPATSNQIWPFKVWETTDNAMTGQPAVRFTMPVMVVDQLISAYEFVLRLADLDSGVPRYEHGESDQRGFGKTASGLSMLMTSAARGIKGVVKNIDFGIIAPSVTAQFDYNLAYETDIDLICDMKCVAKGSSSLIAKEQQSVRKTELLQSTLNPYDMQILGLEGRKRLLTDAMKSMEIDTDEVWKEEDMVNGFAQMQGGMAGPMAGGPPGAIPGRPAIMNQAGDIAGGRDFATFQQGAAA